jgi:S-adenosylmethionine hydrolase
MLFSSLLVPVSPELIFSQSPSHPFHGRELFALLSALHENLQSFTASLADIWWLKD